MISKNIFIFYCDSPVPWMDKYGRTRDYIDRLMELRTLLRTDSSIETKSSFAVEVHRMPLPSQTECMKLSVDLFHRDGVLFSPRLSGATEFLSFFFFTPKVKGGI